MGPLLKGCLQTSIHSKILFTLFSHKTHLFLSEHNFFVKFWFILFFLYLLMHTGVQQALVEFLREMAVTQYPLFWYIWTLQHCRERHNATKASAAGEGGTSLLTWDFCASVFSHPQALWTLGSRVLSSPSRAHEAVSLISLSLNKFQQHQDSLWNTAVQREGNSENLKYHP